MADIKQALANWLVNRRSEKECERDEVVKELLREIEALKEYKKKYISLSAQYCRDMDELKELLVKIKETLTAYSNNDMMGMGADEAITAINKYLEP